MRSCHSKSPWKYSIAQCQPKAKTMKVCKENTISASVWEDRKELDVFIQFKLSDFPLKKERGFLVQSEKKRLEEALKKALIDWEMEIGS